MQINSNDQSTKLQLEVYDEYGRLIEKRKDVTANSLITLGENYKAGVYIVRMIQGDKHCELKLVKL